MTNLTGENDMTITPAPELSPAEAARVAAFDAAQVPPECDPERVETVARAMAEAEGHRWDRLARPLADRYRRLAVAAIAADPSPAEEAVKRVEALCDAQGDDSYVMTYALRAALASPAPAPNPVKEAVRCGRGYTDSEHWIDGYYACPGFASPAPAPQGGAQ